MKKKDIRIHNYLLLIIVFSALFTSNIFASKWIKTEECGVLDGWHQSECYDSQGNRYIVDHFNCSYPETDSGDPGRF